MITQDLIHDGFIPCAWKEHHGSKTRVRGEMFPSLWTINEKCNWKFRDYT